MKLESLKRDNKKYITIGLVVLILVIVTLVLKTTLGAYRNTESIELAKGTINYTLVDFEIVEITIDGQESQTMPVGNYELTSDSYCTEKDDQFKDTKNPEIQLTYKDNILSVSNYTKKGTKCHLVFEEKKITSEDTLAKWNLSQYANDEIKEFKGASCLSGCNVQENGLYKTEDNDGTSYYFRGTVTNNWVKFGENDNGDKDIWWRIVRINGDGTIRLIYSGMFDKNSKPSNSNFETGAGTLVATSQPFTASNLYNDNTYVGFYYGSTGGSYLSNHSNQTPGNAATQLKNWYNGTDWDADKYGQYIDENAGFCNDRTKPDSNTHGSSYTQEGYGNKPTVYGAGHRIMASGSTDYDQTGQEPTLKCGQLEQGKEVNEEAYQRDLFTPKNATKGNQKLEVPVGLITADEVIFAGGFAGQNNQGYYLYNNQYFWTMSPRYFSSGCAGVFSMDDNGYLHSGGVHGTSGVRPVINLKADTPVSFQNGGDRADTGTPANPYVVSTS